jgi:acetyl esterase/lipase
MMDAVLPMNLLLLCRSLYLQSSSSASADADIDPCLSPIVASDALLSQWPTTSIMVGGFDPFVDDSVDFAHRLAANGVPVRLRVFDRAPHSLLDFAPLLQQSADAVQLAERWIEQAAYDSVGDDEHRRGGDDEAVRR